jgi:hypothetical protein
VVAEPGSLSQPCGIILEVRCPRPEPKVLALGAKRLPGGEATFRVYADPAGHPFCLCTQ